MTPLHVAAERAHNDILEVLQKHGAKVRSFASSCSACSREVCFKTLTVCAAVVGAGERSGHSRADGSPQSGAGWSHPDLQAAAELRRRPVHCVSAGVHCSSDG